MRSSSGGEWGDTGNCVTITIPDYSGTTDLKLYGKLEIDEYGNYRAITLYSKVDTNISTPVRYLGSMSLPYTDPRIILLLDPLNPPDAGTYTAQLAAGWLSWAGGGAVALTANVPTYHDSVGSGSIVAVVDELIAHDPVSWGNVTWTIEVTRG